MYRLPRRHALCRAHARVRPWRAAAAQGAVVALLATAPLMPSPHIQSPAAGAAVGTRTAAMAPLHRIILPDLAVITPKGLSAAGLSRLEGAQRILDVLVADGASLTVGGRRVNVLGVNAQQFRSWTPLATASRERLWSALAGGGFVASRAARHRLRLRVGRRYRLGGGDVTLPFAGTAKLGVAGIGLVVSHRYSARLGLIRQVAVLVSAPGVPMGALRREVRAAVGPASRLVSLRQQQFSGTPPATAGRPGSYLRLFQQSAADYCPGLSWTVLAAIGQIESADGANNGPSTAGALGPMQFLPSTWRIWGISAFGQPSPPDVMNPYDAVASAARYLCAAGATSPGGLPPAIYAYNHAGWYVREVLALAQQYARAYG